LKHQKVVGVSVKIILVIALLAGISSGCGGPAAKVEVIKVGPRSIEETVMVAGSLNASNPTLVIPQVWGTVSQVYVEDGQEVAAGQTLVQLDTSQLEQSLLSAQGSLESIQSIASLGSMFSGLSAAIGNLGNSFNGVLSTVDTGLGNLVALERLLVPLLPEDQRMAALQAIESSNQDVQGTISRLQSQANIPSFGGGMDTGAQQAAAGKSIENARNDLKAATITAPAAGTLVSVSSSGLSIEGMMASLMSSFSGMIPSGLNLSALTGVSSGLGGMGMPTTGPISPGSFVSNGTPIFTIVDLKSMLMLTKVDETDIAKIQPGQPASVTLEAYPGKDFTGKVIKVADTATTNEAGATAFEVTLQLNPSDIRLKIGMSATANVVIATKQAAEVVPIDALVEKKGKKYVFKVVDGKALLTEVKLGLTTEEDIEVVEGINMGDRVVTKGVERLKDGQGVKE